MRCNSNINSASSPLRSLWCSGSVEAQVEDIFEKVWLETPKMSDSSKMVNFLGFFQIIQACIATYAVKKFSFSYSRFLILFNILGAGELYVFHEERENILWQKGCPNLTDASL